MINRTILIGYGEVGRAHFEVLKKAYPGEIFYKDKENQLFDSGNNPWDSDGMGFDLMLVATQCDPKDMEPFYKMVDHYDIEYSPKVIDILTTTPVGACEEIQKRLGDDVSVNRSSIRGMHPNLSKFLYDIPKHIGGPGKEELEAYYSKAGITCVLHEKPRLVEFAHKWNNIIYGIMVMATDECAEDARREAIDYMEFVKYRETNNTGFLKAGYPSKVSPVLYPSGGKIGGHCVTYAATTIPEEHRGPLVRMLADYGND
jgi:hypothetical protein